MAFNITDITSALAGSNGIAKPNMFFVRMTPPTDSEGYAREAMYFCDTAQLPGLTFNAVPVRVSGYGTTEQRPIDAAFSPVTTTFIVDAKGNALRFFQQWQALINNWSRETTGIMRGTNLTYGEWNYPKTYEGTVEIHAMDQGSGESIITYELNRAFPIQVGDISVGWEMNDAIMRLPVVFAYNGWNTKHIPTVASDDGTALSSPTTMERTNQLAYGLTLLTNGVTPPQATEFANIL